MLTLARALIHERSRRLGYVPAKRHKVLIPKREVELQCLPSQYDFVTDKKTQSLVAIGGIGAGKTIALMNFSAMKMSEEAGNGTLGGILANTYQQLNQSTLPKLWGLFDTLGFEHGRDYVYNQAPPRFWRGFRSQFRKHNNILSVRYWGQAITRSLDNYDDIRGVELGWAALDELRNTAHEALNVILGRLRCPKCTKILLRAATSPNGFDWIYDEFIERPAREPDLSRRVVHMRTLDNTFLGEEYVRTLYAAYDPRFAQQELEGLFVSLTTGQVYHQFKRSVHGGREDIRPVAGRDWQICFDFNRTPYSVVLCQTGKQKGKDSYGNEYEYDVIYAVDEVSMDDAETRTVCREIFDRIKGYDQGCLIEVFGDPSGKNRDTRGNQSDYDIITEEFRGKYGHRFMRRWRIDHPPVMSRINAVNSMLLNGLGQVRLFIANKCTLLRRDFERVKYKKGSNQIDKSGDANKMLTHLSDALGYFIEERYPVGASKVGIMHL